jgi:hypothetical protein
MTEFLTFDLNEVFRTAVERMQSDGIATKDAYDDLIEELLEEKVELGELSADDDIEEYEDKLQARWPEAQALMTSGHERLEDDA